MEWLLGFSVVLNIGLLVVVAVLVYCLVSAQNEAFHNHSQWERWEHEFYNVQRLVFEKWECHISPSGLKSEMKITKRGE
jgi:hypothetical protein